LVACQKELALTAPDPLPVDPSAALIGGCWVCLPRGLSGPGTDHDPAWCAAVIMRAGKLVEQRVIGGTAAAPYVPGLMALSLDPWMGSRLVGGSGR
jgi:deoxyribonuclease V